MISSPGRSTITHSSTIKIEKVKDSLYVIRQPIESTPGDALSVCFRGRPIVDRQATKTGAIEGSDGWILGRCADERVTVMMAPCCWR